MIAKNIKGKSFGGCVRYIMNDGHELLAAEGVFAENSESIIRSFATQRAGRPEILQPVGHIPLSFSVEDSPRLTNDFLIQLAGEYMDEMGIANTQYVIVRHHNTAHDHIHIIYNRIDNDLRLISVNHDYQRNVKACKKLKDRHGLAYGDSKEKVNREKLHDPDAVKYAIYDTIRDMLPDCTDYHDLEDLLGGFDITVQYKLRRGTDQIEGVSFSKNGIAFKGSAIDRRFSHANLQKTFEENRKLQELEERETLASGTTAEEFDWSKYIMGLPEPKEKPEPSAVPPPPPTPPIFNKKVADEWQAQRPAIEKQPQNQQNSSLQSPSPVTNAPSKLNIAGVRPSPEQVRILRNGGFVYLENMHKTDGTLVSAYVAMDDEMKRTFFFKRRPDEFVKYGKYEMRRMDAKRIEAGLVVKATVKWYGGGIAQPYLWKENPSDTDYKESWDDPRKTNQEQTHKPAQHHQTIIPPKKKQGPKMG